MEGALTGKMWQLGKSHLILQSNMPHGNSEKRRTIGVEIRPKTNHWDIMILNVWIFFWPRANHMDNSRIPLSKDISCYKFIEFRWKVFLPNYL